MATSPERTGNMKPLTMLVVLLVGTLSAVCCKSAPDNETTLAIKLGEKQARVEQLEEQHKALQEQVRAADGKADRLKAENERLTQQVAALQKRLDVAVVPVPAQVPPVAALPVVPAEVTKTPEAATAPLDDTPSIEKVQSIVTGLEAQIAELRQKLEVANNRVAHLREATLDRPAGASQTVLVCGQSATMRAARGSSNRHTHDASCYRTVPGSPAVRGDFRTAYEKESAIQVAREEASPVRLKLAQLTKDHEKARQELGRLRMADKPPEQAL